MRALVRIGCVVGVALVWSGAAHAATFTVTTTADGSNGSCAATCTLRDAITAANAAAGADTIDFGVAGTYFPSSGPLPPVTGPVTFDGTTAPFYLGTPSVILHDMPLVLAGAGITIKALQLTTATGPSLLILGPGGDFVQGCVLSNVPGYGSDHIGVAVLNSSGNQIGGSGPGERNTIQDTDVGILILGSSSGNHIEGNLVRDNLEGILVFSAGNVIGGTASGVGNTVTGNAYDGIVVYGKSSTGNTIQGNLVGSLDGTPGTRNGLTGIYVGAPGTLVGGTSPGARNVVSGNGFDGYTDGAGVLVLTSGNTIQGNYIGTDASGTAASGNNNAGILDFGGGNRIGGAAAGEGNLVSGNTSGIWLWAPGDIIQGNLVGLDASGSAAIANGVGIQVYPGASATTIGGSTTGAGNVVSGNTGAGISAGGKKLVSTVIQGNLVGTTVDGSAAVPNGSGIQIQSGRTYLVGGTTPAQRNVVSGNSGPGIVAFGAKGVVSGNYVGTDVTGTTALPNGGDGIKVYGPSVTVGGTAPGAGNLVSGNEGSGIDVPGPGKTKNLIAGNLIGTNAEGTSALGNTNDGILVEGASGVTIGGATAGARNVISGNGQYGIEFFAPGVGGKNQVIGNLIGTSADGTSAVGNLAGGINLYSMGATIGGGGSLGNVISGNGGAGIFVWWTGNNIYGNAIGTQVDRISPLGNAGYGIRVEEINFAPTGPIGALKAKPGLGNVVAFNSQGGAVVYTGTATALYGNSFFENGGLGIDLSGDGPTPNDPFDPDTGPDGLQNFPVLNAPVIVNGKVTVSGALDSAPGSYTIYLYSNLGTDIPPEGRTLLGSVKMKVAGGGTGTFAYSAPLAAGTQITAVAVDSAGNTSEFSSAVTV